MRRNMDKVRELLLKLGRGVETLEFNNLVDNEKLYIYHLNILEEAGFVTWRKSYEDYSKKTYFDEPRLTWKGNDYLDNIASENIWNKTKKIIISKGIEVSEIPFSIIKEIAKNQLKKTIGME